MTDDVIRPICDFRNRRLCYTLHGLSWIEPISQIAPIIPATANFLLLVHSIGMTNRFYRTLKVHTACFTADKFTENRPL
jgi:hypothetical protein